MKKTLVISLSLLLVASFALAKNVDKGTADLKIRTEAAVTDNTSDLGQGLQRGAAQTGTTFLAYYTFDAGPNCVTEGWASADVTAQYGDFFHVDDFAGLGGGISGLLVPLEGAQSMWCGARTPVTFDPNLCGYAVLPGYGNTWNQAFCTATCLTVTTGVTLSVSVFWDSEPGYDASTLQFDECNDVWADLYGGIGVWDGTGTDTLTVALDDTLHSGSVRFRFNFVSDGAWSDQDGLWDTDGAIVIDELSVDDALGNILPLEDFEGETVGDNDATDWVSCTPPGYGDYAGMYPGLSLVQEDPCNSNLTCVWSFFTGSTVDYSCGGWPGQLAVPYENTRAQYISNEVWSPNIAVAGTGTVWELRFDVYRDLPLGPLVFYVWHIRGVDAGGCPSGWDDYNFVYYGGGKDWLRSTFGVGQFVPGGSVSVNVAVGVADMCQFWGGVYGDCLCHSHAPLLDNVELYRVAAEGPQWQVRDLDLFQDNFSADGTITGIARADCANDILPSSSAAILPGDSVSITVSDPAVGIGLDGGKAAVYCYVSVDGPNGSATGATLIDDTRYNVIGTSVIGGRTWTQIQMDSSYTAAGSVVADDYNIDLNDNLFVPGDTVWYFFGATNTAAVSTYHAIPIPTATSQTDDINLAAANPDEFTILPSLGGPNGGDILYVDGMNFRGAQPFFDTAFDQMGILDEIDRYDIRGPSSAVANHPGSRVQNVLQQLVGVYQKIIYNTGDLQVAFGDGSGTPDKSDDTGMLNSFLNGLLTPGGVYLNGDDVADVWENQFTSASAIQLRSTFMNYTLATGDHTTLVEISPWGIGTPLGTFSDGLGPDTLVAYGGCPLINDFDVITPTGTATTQMSYVDRGTAATAPAVVQQTTVNSQSINVTFILSGFSFHYIRDAFPAPVPARSEHMYRIVTALSNVVDFPVDGGGVPGRYALEQNSPNPFNPTTTIKYQLKESGLVSLRIYNVAGQLVKTLVDGQRNAGQVYEAQWNGLNDAGQSVSSGVYFYKLVSNNFSQTKKMVLLK